MLYSSDFLISFEMCYRMKLLLHLPVIYQPAMLSTDVAIRLFITLTQLWFIQRDPIPLIHQFYQDSVCSHKIKTLQLKTESGRNVIYWGLRWLIPIHRLSSSRCRFVDQQITQNQDPFPKLNKNCICFSRDLVFKIALYYYLHCLYTTKTFRQNFGMTTYCDKIICCKQRRLSNIIGFVL